MRTALVFFIKGRHVFAKRFVALFAKECHFCGPLLSVTAKLKMAFAAIKPSITAWCSKGNLGVGDMLAHYQKMRSRNLN